MFGFVTTWNRFFRLIYNLRPGHMPQFASPPPTLDPELMARERERLFHNGKSQGAKRA